MRYEVRDPELTSIKQLTAESRYQYFVRKAADWEEIWSIGNNEGWVLMSDGKNTLIPIWPAYAFAKECCVNEWTGNEPKLIDLYEWVSKWIPGIINDNRKIAVFPLPNDKGVILSPNQLKLDLIKAIESYE